MSKHLYLVGFDGSEWGCRATEKAINLAQQTGAKVKAVFIVDWSDVQPMIIEGVVPPVLDRDDEEARINKHIILPMLEKYKDSSVPFEIELVWGEPVDVLHQKSKDEHAQMVFVGRRGRSCLADVLLGSVANKLAHCVGVPIVLVP